MLGYTIHDGVGLQGATLALQHSRLFHVVPYRMENI